MSHRNKLVGRHFERLLSAHDARGGGLSLHLRLALTVEGEYIQNSPWAHLSLNQATVRCCIAGLI
jgi:hypothetical protein